MRKKQVINWFFIIDSDGELVVKEYLSVEEMVSDGIINYTIAYSPSGGVALW